MKAKNLDNYEDLDIRSGDLENLFTVSKDPKGNYVYNLNETMYLKFSDSDLNYWQSKYDMQWTLVSYHIYGTTRLAWLLMKINDVQDPFRLIKAGEYVKCLPESMVQQIMQYMITSK